MKKTILLFVLVFSLFSFQTVAVECDSTLSVLPCQVSSDLTLTPDTYIIGEGSFEYEINITAPVTLDCNGAILQANISDPFSIGGIVVSSDSAIIRNCSMYNFDNTNIGGSYGYIHLAEEGVTLRKNILIENNLFNSSNFTALNSFRKGKTTINGIGGSGGIFLENISIINNVFENIIETPINFMSCTDCLIDNNIFNTSDSSVDVNNFFFVGNDSVFSNNWVGTKYNNTFNDIQIAGTRFNFPFATNFLVTGNTFVDETVLFGNTFGNFSIYGNIFDNTAVKDFSDGYPVYCLGGIGNTYPNGGSYAGFNSSGDNGGQDCPCIEDWQPYFTSCTVFDNQTLLYNDTNACGTTDDLPGDNGTVSSCNFCTIAFQQTNNVGDCDVSGTTIYTIDYDITNFGSCCGLTNISVDCTTPTNQTFSCFMTTEEVSETIIDTGGEILEGVNQNAELIGLSLGVAILSTLAVGFIALI